MNLGPHGKPVSSSSRRRCKKFVVLTSALGILAVSGWCGSLAYFHRTAGDQTRATRWGNLSVAPVAPIDTKLIAAELSGGPIALGPDSVAGPAESHRTSTLHKSAEPERDQPAHSDRIAGLGQFGQPGFGAPDRGGGGGNRFGNGGPGGNNGGFGMGIGPGGSGPGGDAGGGVTIDPVVRLQADRTGALENRRKASVTQHPSKGAFASQ